MLGRRSSTVLRSFTATLGLCVSCISLLLLGQQTPVNAQTPTLDWSVSNTGTFGPNDVTVDSSGNVYVTGIGFPTSGSNQDFVTTKYNSSGVAQWTSSYDGPIGGMDTAKKVVVDSSGNVYVAGTSYGGSTYSSGTENDFAVVKYNSSGTQQWAARYNGTGNWVDEATTLLLDSSGNVYVCGTCYAGSTPYNDYVVVKYNSSGTQQWVAQYSRVTYTNDVLNDAVIDSSGNVYVTGTTATVKLDSSGNIVWSNDNSLTTEYNAIALSSSGDVVVTGIGFPTSGSNQDFVTTKYNSSGVAQWTSSYDGPVSGADTAKKVVVDSSGNVYVAGTSYGGSTYSSGTENDFAVVKYNSSGTQQWAARYNGTGNWQDDVNTLLLDSSGNAYVCGTCYAGSTPYYDYVVVKYDPSGTQQWVLQYSATPPYTNDTLAAATIDSSGNIYLTGQTDTLKYNP